MKHGIPVGLLFSEEGPYALIGRDAAEGARLAVMTIEADPAFPFRLVPLALDPAGDTARYAPMAERLFGGGCRHVVGTITSSSRKEALGVAERHRGLLWYAFPYEGYESSENVVYLGATANQHVVPLLGECIARYGGAPLLVAPDYVWGWEVNRIAREVVETAGGSVAGEVRLPVDCTDMAALAARVAAERPSFVLSSLIGPSSHALIAALGAPAAQAGGRAVPLVSCNLTEADARAIGPAVAGALVASIHFGSEATPGNESLRLALRRHSRPERMVSSCFASAFAAVHLLAEAIRAAGIDEPEAVRRALFARRWETVLGPIAFDPLTAHALHAPRLGRARADGGFDVIHRFAPIAPDPYLVHQRLGDERAGRRAAGGRVLN